MQQGAKAIMNPPRPRGSAGGYSAGQFSQDPVNNECPADFPHREIKDFNDVFRLLKSGSVLLDAEGRVCELLFDAALEGGGTADVFLLPGV